MVINPEIKLEKKVDAKLDSTERANLEKLTASDFKTQLQKLKIEKFNLSSKNKEVKLEDIVKNYNTVTGTIDINGERIPVGKGTDLAAWIQVLMVADGKSVLSQKAKERGVKRGIDGDIGAKTTGSINDYQIENKIATKVSTNKEKLPENVLDDLVMKNYIVQKNIYNITVNELGKADADSFKNYKITGPNGKLINASGLNNKLTIHYTSPQNKNIQKIVIDYKNIIDTDGGVDNIKLINNIKDNLANNESKLKANNLSNSVENGIEEVDVSLFSTFMQEYINGKGWIAMNGEIDFNPGKIGSGMTVANGLLTISFPGKGKFSWEISKLQKDNANAFDDTKFVDALELKMTPRAKEWKKEQYANQYNGLKTSISALTSNLSTDYIANTKARIVSLENLSNQIKVDKNVSGTDLIKEIDARKSLLKTRLSYLEMKQRDETKVSGFEKFLNTATPKTAGEKMKFDNEVNTKKGEYKLFRDNFNERVKTYVSVSSTDRSNFDKRLKTIDKLYGYNN